MTSLSADYKKIFSTDDLHIRHRLSYDLVEALTGDRYPEQKRLEKMNNLAFVGHFIELTDLLRKNDIWFACIKGPLLSYRIYGDATTRLSHDIDLLIRPDDVNEVRSLVLNNGYKSTTADWPVGELQQKKMMKLQHHVSFIHEEKKFVVEFHWRLSAYIPISQKKHEAQLYSQFTEVSFNHRSFTVLSHEYELMYLILHGSVHAWFRLKWLVDILHYPIEEIDKALFLQLIKTNKLDKALALTSHLLQIYFQHRFFENECDHSSKKLVDFCQKRIESQKFDYTSTREIMDTQFYTARLLPSFKLFNNFWIRPGDLLTYNFKYIWVYYLIRPFSFIWRRGLNQDHTKSDSR